jgi:16S rRNA (guanine(966)-N(2))-methyltransferase RsmD
MSAAGARNRVRIVGGQWRSRVIRFPEVPGLRPTPDRVRETVFNWLGQDLTGLRCLDLFAGSGALGFEAASRGAREVVMVERDAKAFRALDESRRALGGLAVRLVRADALEFLAADAGQYDVAFLDPPFAMGQRDLLLARTRPRLAPGALVYVEAPQAAAPPAGWAVHRSGRAGTVHYQLLRASE